MDNFSFFSFLRENLRCLVFSLILANYFPARTKSNQTQLWGFFIVVLTKFLFSTANPKLASTSIDKPNHQTRCQPITIFANYYSCMGLAPRSNVVLLSQIHKMFLFKSFTYLSNIPNFDLYVAWLFCKSIYALI